MTPPTRAKRCTIQVLPSLSSARTGPCTNQAPPHVHTVHARRYAAGVLWGGFQDPHTRLSAIYQIVGAFIILVVISAYTANLASLMTIGLIPKVAIDSVDHCVSAVAAPSRPSALPLSTDF